MEQTGIKNFFELFNWLSSEELTIQSNNTGTFIKQINVVDINQF